MTAFGFDHLSDINASGHNFHAHSAVMIRALPLVYHGEFEHWLAVVINLCPPFAALALVYLDISYPFPYLARSFKELLVAAVPVT